ncbi:hypothetical protein NYA22BAC_02410 [Parasphingorhabdus sp. NYA22]
MISVLEPVIRVTIKRTNKILVENNNSMPSKYLRQSPTTFVRHSHLTHCPSYDFGEIALLTEYYAEASPPSNLPPTEE